MNNRTVSALAFVAVLVASYAVFSWVMAPFGDLDSTEFIARILTVTIGGPAALTVAAEISEKE